MDRGRLALVDVDAVGEQRVLGERPGRGQAVHHPGAEAGLGVALVGGVLGDMDVQADAGVPCRLDAGRQRLLGEGEGGVRANHAAGQRGPRMTMTSDPIAFRDPVV